MKYVLIRPQINWKHVLGIFVFACVMAIMTALLINQMLEKMGVDEEAYRYLFFVDMVYCIPFHTLTGRLAAGCLLLEAVILRNRIAIFCVRLYQKYAPASIRELCNFEPCCSNYMIMAIEKYGFVKGIWKGFCRIKRCHYPNGGIDYP